MYYVSTETDIDRTTRRERKGPAKHVIVIRDTIDTSFLLQTLWKYLPVALKSRGVVEEDVVGLFRSGERSMFVTPVSAVELSVLGLLRSPVYYTRPKTSSEFMTFYSNHGWYNFAEANGSCSIASILLDKPECELITIGGSIEVDLYSVMICVADEVSTAKYIRYELADYDALMRLRVKYATLGMHKTLCKSVFIPWEESLAGCY